MNVNDFILIEEKIVFLVIENVSKVYFIVQGFYMVLDGVNLEVKEGEFICIIGYFGCGKFIFLNMVLGFN